MAEILINTLAELQALALLVDWSGNTYIFTSDIDASPTDDPDYGTSNPNPVGDIGNTIGVTNEGFLRISNNTNRFNGVFDGHNFKIIGMKINRPTVNNQALFDYVSTGQILNLGMENCEVIGFNNSAIIVGRNDNLISNCFVIDSTVYSPTGNLARLGGLCSRNHGSISKSYVEGGSITTDIGGVSGGLVGNNLGSINECYANTAVNASTTKNGGLVGENEGNIDDCYATGDVTGSGTIGGFVGSNTGTPVVIISNSYSTGNVPSVANSGGFCGDNTTTTITNCFYDSQTSGQSDTGKGEPRTTSQMQQQSTFTNWDFFSIWKMIDYPELKVFRPQELILSQGGEGQFGFLEFIQGG